MKNDTLGVHFADIEGNFCVRIIHSDEKDTYIRLSVSDALKLFGALAKYLREQAGL
jgi:hypothetical protein